MNLYGAFDRSIGRLLLSNLLFFSPRNERPLGALVYRLVYESAGLHPRPFRVVCFVLIIGNLLLEWWFIKRIANSSLTASLALFAFGFHASLWAIYASTGTIYDILCFTFVLSALGSYVGIRNRGRFPGLIESLWITGLVVCALNSKEMGLALLPLLFCYECIFHPPEQLTGLRRWLISNQRTTIIVAIVCGAYLPGRLDVHNSFAGISAYAPILSRDRYWDTTSTYLAEIFFLQDKLTTFWTAAILLGSLLLALAARYRVLIFGWCFYVLSLIPLSFVPPRSGYVLYIPLVGVAIYVAALAQIVLKLLTAVSGHRQVVSAIFVAAFAFCCIAIHNDERRELEQRGDPMTKQREVVRGMVLGFRQLYPTLPKASRIVVVNDGFGVGEDGLYGPMFLLRLLYHDMTLNIEKVHWDGALEALPISTAAADRIVAYRQGQYVAIK